MVDIFESKNLQNVKHGFFGRSGGMSTGIYSSLNLSEKTSDKKANITVRNFPKTVAQIRKELNIKDGGNIYIFFTSTINEKLKVIVCEKCS